MAASAEKVKSAAVVTVWRADEMTKRGRKAIAKWLRRQAEMLEADGHLYAKRFTGRYLYN